MSEPSIIRRLFLCRLSLCQMFKTGGNDTHLWGECVLCGKRAGIVSREAVRRYGEAEERAKRVDERLEAERQEIIRQGRCAEDAARGMRQSRQPKGLG